MSEQQKPKELSKRGHGGRRAGSGRKPKAGIGSPKRQKWNGFLSPETIEKIKALAAESGLSQGEVVDKAIANANLKDFESE